MHILTTQCTALELILKMTDECLTDEKISLVAKWGKQKISLTNLSMQTTISDLKQKLSGKKEKLSL